MFKLLKNDDQKITKFFVRPKIAPKLNLGWLDKVRKKRRNGKINPKLLLGNVKRLKKAMKVLLEVLGKSIGVSQVSKGRCETEKIFF